MTSRLTAEAQAAFDAVRRARGGYGTREERAAWQDAVLAALESLDARIKALEEKR